MAKLYCPCGWTISDVTYPSSNKSHVISDEDLDAITDYGAKPSKIDANRFRERKRSLLQCSQCDRLHIQEAPGVNRYEIYVKE